MNCLSIIELLHTDYCDFYTNTYFLYVQFDMFSPDIIPDYSKHQNF